ncbi:hypothetical protein [Streptomyces sp. PD-S100-1]|uniref:hypothetical protein n=1 Tax=Streptomyces sp. PD-S100-1 TaxID=3394351 RepID=UPI0039BD3374
MTEDRVPADDFKVGDRVLIADRSLDFGDLYGRAAVLKETRDDEDGYNYRVAITEKLGLVTRNGEYEVWVADVAHTNRNHEK